MSCHDTEMFCVWRKQSVLLCDGVCIWAHFPHWPPNCQPLSESLSMKLSLDAAILPSVPGSPVVLSHSFPPPDYGRLSVTCQLKFILLSALPSIAS